MTRFFRPELDALRFVAFLLVFLHHASPRDPAIYERFVSPDAARALTSIADAFGYGLSLFFFLSAFLITELLVREKQRVGTVKIREFYIRRLLRIWPLYFTGVAIGIAVAIAGRLSGSAADLGSWQMLVLFLALSGNWYFAREGVEWSDNPMTPLWSISIEEQFYLFWPWLVRAASRRTMLCACAALIGLAIAVEFWLGERRASADTTIWANSFVQFEMFGAGAALSLLLRGAAPKFGVTTRIALAIGSAALWFASVHWMQAKYAGPALSGASIVAGYAMITAGCAGLMLSLLGLERPLPARLIYLGQISFGLYVFHLLAIEAMFGFERTFVASLGLTGFAHAGAGLAAAAGALGLTVAMAVVSYRNLETPFLRLKERFSVIASRPV